MLDKAGRFGIAALMAAAANGAMPAARRPPQAVVAQAAQGTLPVAPPAQKAQSQPPAPQPAASQPAPGQVFRGGVNVVRVDIIVTDRQGNAVTDLTQADFAVLEDGKPQSIDLFRLVNSDGTPAPGADPPRRILSMYDEEAEAARDDVRLFVIFLDDYHVRVQNAMRVRDPLIQFVTTQLGPLDMVALMYPLTPVSGLTFSRDRDELARAIRKFEGRKYNYVPRNAFEQEYAQYPAQVVETLRNQVTLSALEGLPVRLGSLREGRKAVILVSEGFVGLMPSQLNGPMAGWPAPVNPAADTRAEDRARFSADLDIQQKLRDVFDAANRNNTAFYALDPRGLTSGDYDITDNVDQRTSLDSLRQSQDTLHVLAINTDGRAITNRNDLADGLKQVVRDTSSYYLVGYNSSLTTPDGKYHKIDVKLKRPGVQVRARKGYWAPTAEEAAKAAAPPKPRPPAAVERALSAVEAVPREAVTAIWIGTSPGPDGRTRVTYVWEPTPPVPGEKRPEPARVALVATGAGREPYFRGAVPDAAPVAAGGDAASPGAAPLPTGLRAPSKATFDVRPGKVQIRAAVETASGQVIDSAQQELVVPDFSDSKVMLSTPSVFCAHTPREMQTLLRGTDPTPSALRQFRRTDRLLIRFSAFGPRTSVPIVTVRLLNRVGQKMSDLATTPPDAPGGVYQVDLPLAGLSPGEYVIEVKASADGGDATELIALRVVS
ncbi:MAG: VWA domain-containing protein [Acidobacteriota bacterium]